MGPSPVLADSIRNLMRIALPATLVVLAGCGGGSGGGAVGGSYATPTVTTGTTTGGSTAATGASVSLEVTKQSDGVVTNSISLSAPATVKATVLDKAGLPVADTVVTFSASDATQVSFSPAATALTDANGVATVTIKPAGLTSVGAHSITANVAVGTATATKTTGVSIGATTVAISALTPTQASISAYGTTTVQATVTPNNVPVSVDFTSTCVGQNRATITQRADAVNGTVAATYTDKGCAGTDTVTATIVGTSTPRTTSLTVARPQIANIQFVESTPTTIVLAGTGSAGSQEVSNVTFRLVDQASNPVPTPTDVSFSLSTSTGGIKLDGVTNGTVTKQTGSDGKVSVQVQSGTVPTPVWVIASVAGNTSITTQSNKLSISTGRPSQQRFSLSLDKHNIEGWNYDGVTTTATINAADRLGNPVPNGTTINFIAEGGSVVSTCETTDGACSVQVKSQEFRPVTSGTLPKSESGRVSLIAYALGEEHFEDLNGNNRYDTGETFNDLGYLYIDRQENSTWETTEQFVPYGNQSTACVNSVAAFDTPSRPNTCDGVWGQAHVRRATVVVFSGSFARYTVLPLSDTAADLPTTATMSASCAVAVSFGLQDVNGNPMPAGSVVSADVSAAESLTATVVNDTIQSTINRGGTAHSVLIKGSLDASTGQCKGGGPVILKVTTPKKNVTSHTINVSPPTTTP